MCTSITVNKKKTLVGFNLDLLDMEYRVRPTDGGVFIEINDKTEGWMPIFGANTRGDFVGMPTCWPYDERSEPKEGCENVINLDIDLLLQKKTLDEIREIAEKSFVSSIPKVTFMSSLTDGDGNVLQIVPGQGTLYFKRPEYALLTNFSPFKGEKEPHPWMGLDRYKKAEAMLKAAGDDFDVKDAFEVLKAASQEVCPTVVSMVLDEGGKEVFWCENRAWNRIESVKLSKRKGEK